MRVFSSLVYDRPMQAPNAWQNQGSLLLLIWGSLQPSFCQQLAIGLRPSRRISWFACGWRYAWRSYLVTPRLRGTVYPPSCNRGCYEMLYLWSHFYHYKRHDRPGALFPFRPGFFY